MLWWSKVAWAAVPDPVTWSASAALLAPGAAGVVSVKVVIPPGASVYQDRVAVVVPAEWAAGPVALPAGVNRPDPADPTVTRPVWTTDTTIDVPVRAPASLTPGAASVTLSVTHQACTTGLCWPDVTRPLVVPVIVLAPG
jgi:hypothetical protein